MRAGAVVGFVLLVGGRAVLAEDEGSDHAVPLAQRVERAVASKDDAALAALARAGESEAWTVVDELTARGRADAARAFASARSAADRDALLAYAARAPREPAGARETLAAAQAALDAGGAEKAVAALATAESLPDGVLKVAWLRARASANEALERRRLVGADAGAAAAVAERLGWKTEAIDLLRRGGFALQEEEDYRGAFALWQRMADLQGAVGDPAGRAETTGDLALLAELVGDARRAVALFERALALHPPDASPTRRAEVRLRYGRTLGSRGELGRAYDELAASMRVLEAGGSRAARAEGYAALGDLYREVGDLAEARAFHAKALAETRAGAADEEDAGEAAHAVAVEEASLAALDAEEGKHEEAIAGYLRVREVFLAAGDRRNAGRALHGVADARLRQRRFPEASARALEAAAELREAQDLEGALAAEATQAEADEGSGNLDAARKTLERLLDEADRRGYAAAAIDYGRALARVRLAQGDATAAIAVVERAIGHLADVYGDLAEANRTRARRRHGELFEIGLRAADRAKDDALFFRFLEWGRAGALLDELQNRPALRTRRVDPTLAAEVAAALDGVRAARGAVEDAGTDRARLADARGALAAARARHDRAVAAVQRKNRQAAQLLRPEPVRLADFAARLGKDEAFVAYATAGGDAYAFVVAGGAGRRVPLGPSEAARRASADAVRLDARADAAAATADAKARLWAPVRKAIPAGVTSVAVSPQGDLGLLPFPALVDPGDSIRTFSFVPSATTADLLRDASARRGTRVLALGISRYTELSRARERLPRGPSALPDLPGAEKEASAVGDPPLLLGANATEEGLRRALGAGGRWSAIHFALHGYTDRRSPSLSWLALAPGPEDDGLLTVGEVLGMDLPTDLAVLSACDAGGGTQVEGEGLVGMVRAFFLAGSPRVVANLWTADDEASLAFSTALHARWKAGGSLTEALEAGRDAVRENPAWSHPSYWAGWCAWGPR
jgi:CHAT domain-containing protein